MAENNKTNLTPSDVALTAPRLGIIDLFSEKIGKTDTLIINFIFAKCVLYLVIQIFVAIFRSEISPRIVQGLKNINEQPDECLRYSDYGASEFGVSKK